MLLAETYLAVGRMKEMVPSVLRLLDLSARFDYEYWLRSEIRKNPEIFGYEDIFDKLPPDLRAELGTSVAPVLPQPVAAAVVSAPVTDLTVNVLGHVEIFRDPSSISPPMRGRRGRPEIFFATSPAENIAASGKTR